MKTRLIPFSALLLATSATQGADTTPAPSNVSWNQNFSLNGYAGNAPNVANPGTSTTGTPPILVPAGTGYPVTDVAAVKALLDVRSALKDSYTLLYNLSDKYGQGTARSQAKDNKGATTSLPDDIGKIVEALAGDEGLAESIKEISDAIGNPAKAPTDPTRNWRQINDLRQHIQDWLNDRRSGRVANAPTPAFDRNINNPSKPKDGESAFRATSGNLFEPIKDIFTVQAPIDLQNPTEKPKTEEVKRDPKLYVSSVNQLAAVRQYYQIREAAVARRQKLQTLQRDIINGIRDAKDFAHLGKLTALANLIEGQLKMCNDDINGAFNDVAVRGIQMFAFSQMQQTAAQEKQQYEMNQKLSQAEDIADIADKIENTLGGPGSTTGTTSGGGFLPWPIRR